MARHRKTPASRYQARGRDDSPASSEAPERRFGSAMRRLVVTPTFAAGLGVVVAAVLAYPMQTVFSYVAPGASGRGGLLCTGGGCGHRSGPGRPSPFGAGGGALSPPSPAPAKGGNDGPPASPVPQTGGGIGGTAIAEPRLSYKITSKWQGGFWGQVTITFPGAVPPKWSLRIGYPTGHILGMNPGSRLAPNGHAVVVRSTDYAGGSGPGKRTFAIGVGVQGAPTHPGRCSFNGRAC